MQSWNRQPEAHRLMHAPQAVVSGTNTGGGEGKEGRRGKQGRVATAKDHEERERGSDRDNEETWNKMGHFFYCSSLTIDLDLVFDADLWQKREEDRTTRRQEDKMLE